MIYRECAGGIVFRGEEVFLLCDDKDEWVFPKGVLRDGASYEETALYRVWAEAGLRARIILEAGSSEYEFYSISRKAPVHNRIRWFIMTSQDEPRVDRAQGFTGGRWWKIGDALKTITYTQDRRLLQRAWEAFRKVPA